MRIILSLVLIFLSASSALAEMPEFIRLKKDEAQQAVSLDTAVVNYIGPNGESLDLVGAVHIGEESYFEQLNKLFGQYDAVLYELIAPKGEKPRKAAPSEDVSIISSMQVGMTEILNLAFQLEEIDYNKSNFVHADATPDEFFQSMKDRNETFFSIMMRLFSASLVQQSTAEDRKAMEAQIFVAMFTKDPIKRAKMLKKMMAAQFKDGDLVIEALNGKQGSTIISGRNDIALKVLREELAKGKKNLAIYYGAGHMPDFHRKLLADFGFKAGKSSWIEAWNLR